MEIYTVRNNRIQPLASGESGPFERVDDEHSSWLEYRALHAKTSDPRYAKAAQDEFSHMLIALMDALTAVQHNVKTPEEQAQWKKFQEELAS